MAGRNSIEQPFDWQLYGQTVRTGRTSAGFDKAGDFAECMTLATGVRFTREMVYKIEQGRQAPDAGQFLALNLVLFGEPAPVAICRHCAKRPLLSLFPQDGEAQPFGEVLDSIRAHANHARGEALRRMMETAAPAGTPWLAAVEGDGSVTLEPYRPEPTGM